MRGNTDDHLNGEFAKQLKSNAVPMVLVVIQIHNSCKLQKKKTVQIHTVHEGAHG